MGASIGTDNFIKASLNKRVNRIAEITDKLHLIEDPQAEFCLLRNCLSLPKFEYAARTTHPAFHADPMSRFDALMREALSSVIGHTLDDKQWRQATLPVSMGGMGLRQAALHSSASYVTSIAHSYQLVSEILSPLSYTPFHLNKAMDSLNSVVDDPLSFQDLKSIPKKQVSHAIDSKLKHSVLASASSTNDKVRLLSVSKCQASAWLNVVPNPGLGLSCHPPEFRCAALYRLGAPIFE